MNYLFSNREDAGIKLAQIIKESSFYKKYSKLSPKVEVILVAIPRGGVPVAYEIAKELKLRLYILVSRKLSVPYHKELAFGAISLWGSCYLDESIKNEYLLSNEQIKQIIKEEKIELIRRENLYHSLQDDHDVRGKVVILVDDGLATGCTIKASLLALKLMIPKKIIIAVPVACQAVWEDLKKDGNEIFCLHRPASFKGVGLYYREFYQVSDEEVLQMMNQLTE